YPPTCKAPQGKLRLRYQANPTALLVQQAGAKALCAPGARPLDIQPTDIHQRVPAIIGSSEEVDHVARHLSRTSRPRVIRGPHKLLVAVRALQQPVAPECILPSQ